MWPPPLQGALRLWLAAKPRARTNGRSLPLRGRERGTGTPGFGSKARISARPMNSWPWCSRAIKVQEAENHGATATLEVLVPASPAIDESMADQDSKIVAAPVQAAETGSPRAELGTPADRSYFAAKFRIWSAVGRRFPSPHVHPGSVPPRAQVKAITLTSRRRKKHYGAERMVGGGADPRTLAKPRSRA